MRLNYRLCLTLTILFLFPLFSGTKSAPAFSCSHKGLKTFGFCQRNVSLELRAKDLVERLNLEEKISQLVHNAPAIPRLDIPAFNWWSEALHGLGRGILFNGTITSATSFPQVILTGATFDEKLWYRIGQAIGREARAMYNHGQATGMTFWAPNINVFRDPRWGRGQETPGEDPILTGKYAVSFVRGIQGPETNHLQVSACCKHFVAYDLENWLGVDRYKFNAIVTKQDMVDTFGAPFKDCVKKARASCVMCAYNSVNGVPNCANKQFLTKTVREKWDFHGYIASDCNAVHRIFDAHNYSSTPEEAAADVLKAGMDVECGEHLKKYTKSALGKKYLSESELDRALHNLFAIRMRLGLFDGNPQNLPYGSIGPNEVCNEQHQTLALEAAREGIVLLNNSGNLLPLSKTKTRSLAVIGPNGNRSDVLLGNYHGTPCRSITVVEALQSYVKNTSFHSGCNAVDCTSVAMEDVVKVVKHSDQVVLVMGLDQDQERESLDRVDLVLPGQQQNLINQVALAAKRPVILVLLCGGPLDISFAQLNPKIGSILWAGYPGEAGGIALGEIIFGDHNPSGRLPSTWYPQSFVDNVPMTDMRMRPDPKTGYPGRTYRFYKGPKLFNFGHGLSYTEFKYSLAPEAPTLIHLELEEGHICRTSECESIEATCNAALDFHVQVKNIGNMSGSHSVLLFSSPPSVHGAPQKHLVGFQKLHLRPYQQASVSFSVNACKDLSIVDEEGRRRVYLGEYVLQVGELRHCVILTIV